MNYPTKLQLALEETMAAGWPRMIAMCSSGDPSKEYFREYVNGKLVDRKDAQYTYDARRWAELLVSPPATLNRATLLVRAAFPAQVGA